MDPSTSLPSASRAPVSTLAALLGVEGPLRFLPQGPAPKPHIILKRDTSSPHHTSADTSSGVVRFSFVAGKKLNLAKGQQLLFAVLPPSDGNADEQPLSSAFAISFLEADLPNPNAQRGQQRAAPTARESAAVGRRAVVEDRLPPKMRKGMAYKEAYANYVSSETTAPPAHGSVNTPAPRVLVDSEVQTDTTPQLIPHKSILPRPLSRAEEHPDESPTQLPSPVSADHTREIVADAHPRFQSADVDDYARSDRSRSLSPMDLGSENSTPATTIAPLPTTIYLNSEPSLLLQSPQRNVALPSSAPVPAQELKSDSAAESTATTLNAPSAVAPLAPLSTEPSPREAAPPARVLTPQPPTGKHGDAQESILTEENAAGESARLSSNAAVVESAPSAPCPTPQGGGDADEFLSNSSNSLADAPAIAKEQRADLASQAAPTSVKSVHSSLPRTWDRDSDAAPYIPTSTIGNPLGIRPSSSLKKPIPTGPRSLQVIKPAATSIPKKPVVVGAKWSAARNAGPSAPAPCATASSSAPQAAPISPPRPAPPVMKANLADMIHYSSPSPPPTEPRPPSPAGQLSTEKDDFRVEDYASPPWSSDDGNPASKAALGLSHRHQGTPKWSPRLQTTTLPTESKPDWPMDYDAPSREDKVNASGSELTPEASPPPSAPKSRKRTYEDWKVDHWSPSQDASKKQKVSESDACESTPWTSRPSISAPSTSGGTGSRPVVVQGSSASRVKNQYDDTGSWSTPVIVPIPKVPMGLNHPLPPKPEITASSYRPSTSSSRRKKSRPPPPPRETDWPSTSPSAEYLLQSVSGAPVSVLRIIFNGEGTHVAFICSDRTLRIWENKPAASEIARLQHSSPIASACWLEGDSTAVMTMCADGTLCTWTRNAVNEWKFAILIKVPELPVTSEPFCMAYHGDRIAVSMMSVVKVWLCFSGKWLAQREIARSGVTALKFVQDGDALIGGCRDGVLWYCEMPNGTLRVHAFLPPKPIISIDTHPTGTYLLVGQEGGIAYLMTMRPNQNKGNVERVYTSEKIQAMSQKGFPAVFATKGQAVLYGTMNDCALVWDRKKGTIVYGLKHPEGDPVETAATFDGRPGVEGWMITGTQQGRVFWWPVPVAAAPGHSTGSRTPDVA